MERPGAIFLPLLILLFISLMQPTHSESSNCVIKREQERCLERIALHDPTQDQEFGEKKSMFCCLLITVLLTAALIA
ncbi:hypothetical protein AOLI_G00214330 [Acnodon oligacanthus]